LDGNRFDDLARWLNAVGSRRTVTRILGAGVLVAPLSTWRLGDTTAKAKGKGKGKKSCPPCKKRKQGKCKGNKPEGTACTVSGGAGTCRSGSCVATPSPGPPPPGSPPSPPPPPPDPAICTPVGGRACEGICTAEQDFCTGGMGNFRCGTFGNSCICVVRPNGFSYCAHIVMQCSNCTTDDECVSSTGDPAAICMTGGECNCPMESTSLCLVPCPKPGSN
jgi:hypothetical protein